MSDEQTPSSKPFGEARAEAWKGIKGWVNGPDASGKIDPSVRESINVDLDKHIEKDETAKPWPGSIP